MTYNMLSGMLSLYTIYHIRKEGWVFVIPVNDEIGVQY